MKKKIIQNNAIAISDLPFYAKANPEYTQLFLAITKVDAVIRTFVREIICDTVTNPDDYFIKTDINHHCYNLYLFQKQKGAIIGISSPMVEFLNQCKNKTIEATLNQQIRKAIYMFRQENLKKDGQINWLF